MGKTGGNERNTKERWRNTRKKRRTFFGISRMEVFGDRKVGNALALFEEWNIAQ
ncbi:MAG: hypothetical protein ACLRS1_03380 [Oscillospiraceae bacterium]